MVVGLSFIGGWYYSELMAVQSDNTWTVLGRWNASRVIPRCYGWVYKTLRFSPLVVKHSAVVMTGDSQSGQSQIES